MKKICFVVPTLQKGGMERVVSELSNYLINTHSIIIICAIKGQVKYELDDRVTIIKNDNYNKYKIVSFLSRVINENRPDVVLGFSEFLNPYTIISSKLNSCKVFVSDRSNPVKKHSLRDMIFRKLSYPFADGLMAQTEFAKTVFIRKSYNKNIFVVPNLLMKIQNTDIQAHQQGIIMVGRFTETKNQKDLIEIFSQCNNTNWTLYLVGDGTHKKKLMKMAVDLNISDQIVFTGELSDVEEYMKKCSIFAFTSISEGFPNALSEAMAFPLACIAYNCKAGVSDLITNNENGFLIDEGDKTAFKKQLNILLSDADLRLKIMKKGILNREKFNPKLISEQLLINIL